MARRGSADQGVTLEQLFGVWDALTEVGIRIKDVPARIELPTPPETGEEPAPPEE